MLDNSRVRHFPVGVVYYRIALIVIGVEYLVFKPYRAVTECAVSVTEKFVYLSCENGLFGYVGIFLDKFEIVGICLNVRACEHLFDYLSISAYRYALIAVIEIVVVIGESERQTLYYKRRKLGAGSAPLLLRVALYQLFVNVRSDQLQCLFLEVLRLAYVKICYLTGYYRLCFSGRLYSPHFAESVHIERQIVKLVLVGRYRGIDEVVEIGKAVHIFPYCFV